jgi:uracil-DNA glycosylase
MKPYGEFRKGILNIGEAPGELEDRKGKQWQGKVGKLLEETYRSLGINLFEDCLNINAVNCRPTDEKGANRSPTNYEIECCRRHVLSTIEQYKPKVIVLFGNSPVYSLLNTRWKGKLGGITKWRGWTIPDQELKAWICPTFHPSFVHRSSSREVTTIWEQDLERIVSKVSEPFPKSIEPEIHYIENLKVLNRVVKPRQLVAIDYETTGIKPHAKGHRIVCVSVAVSENKAYVFMMPEDKEKREPFINLLANKSIRKTAQNMKYEENWSVVQLNQSVQGWEWDSMLVSHQLDNRVGITGLKFQAYVNFGIAEYDSEVNPYLKSSGSDGNSLNKVDQLLQIPGGKKTLMKYCALDTIYEYRLAMRQMKIIGYEILPF